jgi:tetratricopeptide (TPR) repeat protein
LKPSEAYPQAKKAASRALEIDSSLVEAQVALAFARFLYDWDWSAEDGFRKAIQSNPGYAPAHQWYGVVLVSQERYDEAMTEEEHAVEADPYSLIIHSVKAWVAYLSHRYDDAIVTSRQSLDLDAKFMPAHDYLGMAYEAKGMYPEAIRELEAMAGDRPFELAALAHAYGRAGRTKQARRLIADFEKRAKEGYFPAYFIAISYAGLGDRDAAFDWLEKAYQERFPWLIHLKADPRLEMLHNDPRFASLVSRVGLSQ